jgi:putative FmdB family regulatory protein
MPTYEYKCKDCEEIFERFQKITDPPLEEECPVCGGKLTRLISGGIGIIFKGSGFYVTDSKGARNNSFVSKEKEAESSDAGEAAGSGESKSSGELKSSGEPKGSGGKDKSTETTGTKVATQDSKESKKEGSTKK